MSREIRLSQTAVETYEAIFEQISSKFGKMAAEKFENKTFKTFRAIANTPFIFKSTEENPSVRKGWINKNCSFFYQVDEDQIYILFFWDNRQEPLFK